MQATRGSIQFLGRLSGAGTLTCDSETMGRATFEIDGFRTRTGEIVGSGEVRMTPEELDRAFGRTNLTLTTDVACRVTITSSYGGKPKRLDLRPGRTTYTVTTTSRWYDVSIVTDSDPTYLRRYAGHVETGTPGTSDPAIRSV